MSSRSLRLFLFPAVARTRFNLQSRLDWLDFAFHFWSRETRSKGVRSGHSAPWNVHGIPARNGGAVVARSYLQAVRCGLILSRISSIHAMLCAMQPMRFLACFRFCPAELCMYVFRLVGSGSFLLFWFGRALYVRGDPTWPPVKTFRPTLDVALFPWPWMALSDFFGVIYAHVLGLKKSRSWVQ